MPAVTETTPGTAVTANAKADVQAVPSGQDDNWAAAADFNKLNQFAVTMSRAVRLQAAVALLTGAAEAVSGAVVRLTGEYANGLPRVTKVLTTDLNKVFAAAVEKIEQGGDLDGCAASTPGFGVYAGIVSGVFTTGALYGLGASGALITYTGGALPPVAIGLNTQYAYVDLGGRPQLDNATLNFANTGKARVPSTADLVVNTLGVGELPKWSAAGIKKAYNGFLRFTVHNTDTSSLGVAVVDALEGTVRARVVGYSPSYTLQFLRSKAAFLGTNGASGTIYGNTGATGIVEYVQGGATSANVYEHVSAARQTFKRETGFSTVTAPDANVATFTVNLPDGLSMGDVSMCWLRTYDAIRAKTTYQLTCLVK